MYRIMFVCHGNICRSPMAEFVLKDMVARRGIDGKFHIESAATSTDEIGNCPHPGTVKMLEAANISCKGKRARRLRADDYDDFDMFIGMDEANIRNMRRMLKGDPEGKVYKMLEFADSNRDVADPWYTGDFDATYNDVVDGCMGLLAWLGEKA